MAEDRNSYKNITKAIGLFGGVQVFNILAGIIKNKIVAVLLGPVGMGISGILISTTSMISSATGLGLHTSAVRDVAKAYSSKDEKEVGTVCHYPIAPHKQECYAKEAWNIPHLSLPITERLADEKLSLPIGPAITMDEVKTVVDFINRYRG